MRSFSGLEVAVIGMSCEFPGASNHWEFWNNIAQKKDTISHFQKSELAGHVPEELLWKKEYVPARGVLKDHDSFDPEFFGFTRWEADKLEPQVRKLYECVWHALEDSGYATAQSEQLIGLYAGIPDNLLWKLGNHLALSDALEHFNTNTLTKTFFTTLLSYKLNLKGPSVFLQTACSTSLVAVHLACQGLLSGECAIAIAGGASIVSPQKEGYLYKEGMILSADGFCRPFDEEASGTVFSNGAGVVVLKRLEDAITDKDHIYAVIKGTAVNNDGYRKSGYSAPSVEGQSEVILSAIKMAEVDPESIGYIECHGTATRLGDPIEIEGLKRAFDTVERNYCAIGSVKGNIGHTDAAAGIAGFIKTVLALKYRQLPPTLNFKTPNREIDFSESPFYVNTELRSWASTKDQPLRAGVSSFGIGGTNAHVVLEDYEPEAVGKPDEDLQRTRLLVFSARTPDQLDAVQRKLCEFICAKRETDFSALAFNLQVNRKHFEYRGAVACRDMDDAIILLSAGFSVNKGKSSEHDSRVIFLFPGQGSQYKAMGQGLYERLPYFRQKMDVCFKILLDITGIDYRTLLYAIEDDNGGTAEIDQTALAQPLLFSFEYSLAQLLIHWGIKPYAMLGHSLGEYVAGCLASVFSLEDALFLVSERGRLMQAAEPGAMMSVALSEPALRLRLIQGVEIAAINDDLNCVVAGDYSRMNAFGHLLESEGIAFTRLHTSHAFHSYMMDDVVNAFKDKVAAIKLNEPNCRYISNVTGEWIRPGQATSPQYWALHIRQPVLFGKGVKTLQNETGNLLFAEIGPGTALNNLVESGIKGRPNIGTIKLTRHRRESTPDEQALMNGIGRFYLHGVPVQWEKLYDCRTFQKIPLPGYPFGRTPFRADFPGLLDQLKSKEVSAPHGRRKGIADWLYAPGWKKDLQYSQRRSGTLGNILLMSSEASPGSELACCLRDYGRVYEGGFQIGPDKLYVFELFQAMQADNFVPDKIVHLLNFYEEEKSLSDALDFGFYSIIHICQAIEKYFPQKKITIEVITNQLFRVGNEAKPNPIKATLLGPLSVVNKEHPNITARCIDVEVLSGETIPTIVDQIFAEPAELIHAIRLGTSWIRTIEKISFPSQNSFLPKNITKGNTYLITGGLGAIGYEIAKYLLTTFDVNLVLAGRSTLIETKPDIRFERFENLKKCSPNVHYLATDISCHQAFVQAIALYEQQFHKINGVIHTAGIGGGKLIQLVEKNQNSIFDAKINGTLSLYEIFKGRSLDFFLLFSSISSIVPVIGGAEYNAANSFLDAFASAALDTLPIKVVNWDAWRGTSMALGQIGNQMDDRLQKQLKDNLEKNGIEVEEGLKIFASVLNGHLRQTIVSTTDLQERINNASDILITNQLISEAIRPEHFTDLSRHEKLMAIWRDVLGQDPDSCNNNFFSSGGDSLKALLIVNRIKRDIGVDLSIGKFFELQTLENIYAFFGEDEAGPAAGAVKPAGLKELYCITDAEKRLYFLQSLDPAGTVANLPNAVRIRGPLDIAKMRVVFSSIVERHASLRTNYIDVDGEIFRRIRNDHEFSIEVIQVPLLQTDQILTSLIQPFDLENDLLIRVKLLVVGIEEYVLFIDVHHIVYDGISMSTVFREFIHLYRGGTLEPLASQFYDYSESLASRQDAGDFILKKEYWMGRIGSTFNVPDLPYDFERPVVQTWQGDCVEFALDAERALQLKELCRQNNCTLSAGLLSFFYLLIWKLTDQTDFIIGVISSGRNDPAIQNLVGVLINSLPFKIPIYPDDSMISLLKMTMEITLADFQHQDYPFGKIIEDISAERTSGRSPLFDIAYMFHNEFSSDDLLGVAINGISFEQHPIPRKSAMYDLTLKAVELGNEIRLQFEYKTALFERSTIQNFSNYFVNLIYDALDNRSKTLKELSLVDPALLKELIFQPGSQSLHIPNSSISDLFDQQVAESFHKTAVVFGNNALAYGQLQNRVEGLVQHLEGLSYQGEVIAILVPRSIELVIAILAVLKSNKAYLPLDPNFPPERISYMIRHSGAGIVLVTGNYFSHEQGDHLVLNFAAIGDADTPDARCKMRPSPSSMAYLIYTSGSTGIPKGIAISHANIVNFIYGIREVLGLKNDVKFLSLTTVSFDIFVLELFLPLLSGETVVIASGEMQIDNALIEEAIVSEQITALQLTPSRLKLLLEVPGFIFPSHVTTILVGGEAFPELLLSKLKSAFSGRIFNMYGPTETAVWSSVKELTMSDQITLGYPIANTQFYVVNQYLQLLPDGVKGELLIGGKGVAIGYWRNELLTSQKFISNPFFADDTKLFKTGDLVKRDKNGELVFYGRNDNQVKIRGYRVEPGEIEKALIDIDVIEQAVVLAVKKDEFCSLHAFLKCDPETDISLIRNKLNERLPAYMVPDKFFNIPFVPLTPNNKVDRLMVMKTANEFKSATHSALPKTQLEKDLWITWKKVIPNIPSNLGVDDNVFDVGGNSFLLGKLRNAIEKFTGISVPVATFFQYPTISTMAAFLDSLRVNAALKTAKSDFPLLMPVGKKRYYPLSYNQSQLWYINRLDPGNISYNIVADVSFQLVYDRKLIDNAIRELANRHMILCSRFVIINGIPFQELTDQTPNVRFEETMPDCDASQKEVAALLAEKKKIQFNLEGYPPIDVTVVKEEDNLFRLIIAIHHIIADAWSLRILHEDFRAIYTSLLANEQPHLPAIPISYFDFSSWQASIEHSSAIKEHPSYIYWKKTLGDRINPMKLGDRKKLLQNTAGGGTYTFYISDALYEDIQFYAKELNTFLSVVLYSSFVLLLGNLSGESQIICPIASSGREEMDLEHTVGYFANTLIITNRIDGELVPEDFIRETHANIAEAIKHQHFPISVVLNDLHLRTPEMNVFFNMRNINKTENVIDPEALKKTEFVLEDIPTKFALALYPTEFLNTVRIGVQFSAENFSHSYVMNFGNRLIQILTKITRSYNYE